MVCCAKNGCGAAVRGKKITRREFLKLAYAAGVGAVLGLYPLFIERYAVQVNTYIVRVPNLPPAFSGFRIVQLTDLHLGFLMPIEAVAWVVDLANRLNCEVIACTGDYVHERNSADQIDTVWPVLSRLSAPFGVYSVLGNHDHWADTPRSLYWLERSGQNLRHCAVPIEKDGSRLWLGGSGDLWEDEDGLDAAFQNAPPEECKIVLAHNPDSADIPRAARFDLMLSGHTHGGQLVLPFVGPPFLPVINKRYSSGYFQTPRGRLFISRGIGWTVFPARLNCPPEIAVLELRPAA
jgi:predicted MPP superfamily phosphohydrolase